jgi:hypothetical protein
MKAEGTYIPVTPVARKYGFSKRDRVKMRV